nr:isochorismate synthase [Metabacillus mangrovi]
MGGFSFDPLKNSSADWTSYKNGRFTLPKYLCRWERGKKPEVTICKVLNGEESFIEAEADFLGRIRYIESLVKKSGVASGNPAPFEMMEHHTDDWLHSIIEATAAIKEGQLDKVVLAREISMKSDEPIDVRSALDTLIKEQQTSFRFVIENGSSSFIGATPERLIKIQDRFMQSACLAGTIKRGSSKKEDRALENSLLNDQKNLEEHAYVVKMIREALQEHSSELMIPENPGIYKTKNVQHLFTPIEGSLSEDSSLLHIVRQLHPTPALGGLPQQKALEMIRDLEPMERGWYAAPVGWMDAEGNGEFAVAIRSALVKDHSAVLYAGCGIVKDSIPEMEYEETKIKLRPMLSALGGLKYDRS